MSPDTVTILMLVSVALLLFGGIVILVLRRKGIGNFASLTAYHDFQTKDKQEAVEIVMEKRAGKKMRSEGSGRDKI